MHELFLLLGDSQPVTISAILVVLMGTIGALVILAIIIIFIMKGRGEGRSKYYIICICQFLGTTFE